MGSLVLPRRVRRDMLCPTLANAFRAPPFSRMILERAVAVDALVEPRSCVPALTTEQSAPARVRKHGVKKSPYSGAFQAGYGDPEPSTGLHSAPSIQQLFSGLWHVHDIGGIPSSNRVGILVCNSYRSGLFDELTRRTPATCKLYFTSTPVTRPVLGPGCGDQFTGPGNRGRRRPLAR